MEIFTKIKTFRENVCTISMNLPESKEINISLVDKISLFMNVFAVHRSGSIFDPGWPCAGWPALVDLYRLCCSGYFVPVVLSWLSCPVVLSQLSSPHSYTVYLICYISISLSPYIQFTVYRYIFAYLFFSISVSTVYIYVSLPISYSILLYISIYTVCTSTYVDSMYVCMI
jgi:hypothetical protein